ncbi:MAG: acyl-CoA thioesterase [Deltaproteobacteria bacterium]|nr:acyl-CoA thioesterase [Deltaproteobacteria bacterium]
MNFPFKHSLSVRFSDVDGLGHTNNAAYITYFEEARLAMMRRINLKSTKTWQGFPFIVANVSCDFKVATFGADLLDIHCRISKIGNASFDIEYVIKKNDSVVARGKSVQVTYDYDVRGVIPISDELRKELQKLV